MADAAITQPQDPASDRPLAARRPAFIDTLEEYGELTRFSGSALREVVGARRYTSEILRQAAILVRGSTVFVFFLCFMVGVATISFGYAFLKDAGAADVLGLVAGLGFRVGPAFTFGYIFSAKVGCGLVAEIGAMRINEELDAYEAEGVGAMRYVVATRVAGAMIFLPIAAGIAMVAFIAGAYVDAILVQTALPSATFDQVMWGVVGVPDLLFNTGLIFLIGMTITLVSCYYGYSAKGGPDGVGSASARSLVVNLVMVHVLSGVMFFIYYNGGQTIGLGIGG